MDSRSATDRALAAGATHPTPAEADRELLGRGAELTPEEIERLASIADRHDEEVAQREMPDSDGWTEEQRAEVVASWREGRRWLPRLAMRPDETADEWRERCIAQSVAEQGCALLVIPARRREDVVEVDLATVPRRRRRRLFGRGGSKSHEHARRQVLSVLRECRPAARRTPVPRRVACRPRRSSSSSRTSGADPGDDDGEAQPAAVAPPHGRRRRTAGGRA